MKNLLFLLIVGCFFILTPKDSNAQPLPQPFAGGEIVVNPVGTAPCGGLHRFEIILKYYRDCGGGGSAPPATAPITIANARIMRDNPEPSTAGFVTTTLTQFDNRGEMDNECVKGDPICTSGMWYRGEVLLEESEVPWSILFGRVDDGEIRGRRVYRARGDLVHSVANVNIEEGQAYTMRTDFRVECEDIATIGRDVPPNYTTSNTVYDNQTAVLLTEDLLQTFCHDQEYEFQIPIIDYDNPPADLNFDGVIDQGESLGPDSLHFELTSALKGDAAVLYVSPYASTLPVPLEVGTKMDLSRDGFLKFKPSLLPGENSFIGAVTIRVSEYRKRVVQVPKNFGGGANYDSLVYEYDPEPIAVTYRQFRYVIDRRCNKNLPEFTRDSVHWNKVEEAWEFDCATQNFTFDMSFPMYEHSLKRGPRVEVIRNAQNRIVRRDTFSSNKLNDGNLDIRIFSVLEDSSIAFNSIPVFDVIPIDQTPLELALGEFSKFTVRTKLSLGPGKYSFFFKLGEDENTLINRCGFEVEEFTSIPVFINGAFDYEYFDRGDSINICYPQSDIEFNPLVGQPNVNFGDEFEFKFHYGQNRQVPPAVEWDTSFIAYYAGRTSKKNSYTDTIRLDSNDIPILKEGRWKIGLGRVYRTEAVDSLGNDTIYKKTCFDDDDVFVNIFENKQVIPRKWDLCPDEAWPVINLDSMSKKYNAQDYIWGYETKIANESGGFFKDQDGNFILDTLPVGGSGNPEFPLSSIAFGNKGYFLIESIVQLENGECFDTSYFEIRKGPIDVNIGNDSIICPGQQYMLVDTISHYTPDSMRYEWYLNGSVLPDADSNSVMITESGTYKLRVYKRSELDNNLQQVICYGEDSVKIEVADSLIAPVPICSKVRFLNDSVRQLFFWPQVEGADGYQVKVITPYPDGSSDTSDWVEPNGEYNLLHNTAGRQVSIFVRAYNQEVPESSICRYGPVSFTAEACNVVIKPVNIFTPNGDGINDVLRFDLLEIYIGNQLQIFNRWGEMLYEDNDYLNDWDGGDLKDGTYFYVLKAGDETGSILKGNVTIVR